MNKRLCHVCPKCGGKGTTWDRLNRRVVLCTRCGGDGSGLSKGEK